MTLVIVISWVLWGRKKQPYVSHERLIRRVNSENFVVLILSLADAVPNIFKSTIEDA